MAKVTLERDGCIGCSACTGVCPQYWRMNDEDGKADLIGSKSGDGGRFMLELRDDGLECNREAEKVCPVDVIKIVG